MIEARKSLVKGKLREGFDRVVRENPSIDWSVDTDETREAEKNLDNVAILYIEGKCRLVDLKNAFDVWATAQTTKPKEQLLF